MSYIFYAFLAYLLYLFVFRLVIPIYRTTRQVRRGFRDMQERMNGKQPRPSTQRSTQTQSNPKAKGDYIDFEEIKE